MRFTPRMLSHVELPASGPRHADCSTECVNQVTALLSTLLLMGASCSPTVSPRLPNACSDCATNNQVGVGCDSDEPGSASVEIAASIRNACEIRETDKHFDYDALRLQTRDAHIIAELASCLSEGPLVARQIQLIGYGVPISNSRQPRTGAAVDTLKQALVERRVAPPRISIAMLGESERGVCSDRRVFFTLRSANE